MLYYMKKNINTTYIHENVKIIWIKENICQNLYNILNTIWYKKYKYDIDIRIVLLHLVMNFTIFLVFFLGIRAFIGYLRLSFSLAIFSRVIG